MSHQRKSHSTTHHLLCPKHDTDSNKLAECTVITSSKDTVALKTEEDTSSSTVQSTTAKFSLNKKQIVRPSGINTYLFETGKYSDITIECNGWGFRGHKSVLCPQNEFIAKACEGGFEVFEQES